MAKRRISMFEAFGTNSSKGAPKGSQGSHIPQRSETQRAIDAQRGLDPREPRTPSAEVLRALRAQVEAEFAAARGAARTTSDATATGAVAELASAVRDEPTPSSDSDAEHQRAEFSAAAAIPARALQPMAPAQRTHPADGEPSAPEGGFTLPFGWVTFLCLQLGLFAVAFGLGALTAGGGTAAAGDGTDLRLGEVTAPGGEATEAAGRAPGKSPGNLPTGARGATQPPRSPVDPQGVRGGKATPKAADSDRAAAGGGVDDPYLAAFLKPENVFTLQVASYDGSPNGQGMARHWQGYLRERQLPAVLRQVGTRLGLFVGASPNSLEIEELQKQVGELRDERGAHIFASPRVVNLKEYR